ncbi:hypothetical protein BH10ACT1_BH10ACT1_03280 [soil metagenome]
MTLRALCHSCTEPFDLADLYGADPTDANRCPHCGQHLGSAGLGHTTFRIERHLKALTQALHDLAAHPGGFTIDTTTLRADALEAIEQLDEPPPLDTSTRTVSAARH